jgi:phosphotransferase system HPr (HPr) family protein
MMSIILLMLHNAAQATNAAGARPDEDKPESNRSARLGARKVEKEIAIANRFGLHLRHAARFAQVANRFYGDVRVAKGGTEVNGKSILDLITLGAAPGSRLRIRIEGPDGSQAMREIERLIQSWSDEDQI